MKRRGFLGALAGAIASAAYDPERALFVPGRKLISIPPTVKPRIPLPALPPLEWIGDRGAEGLDRILAQAEAMRILPGEPYLQTAKEFCFPAWPPHWERPGRAVTNFMPSLISAAVTRYQEKYNAPPSPGQMDSIIYATFARNCNAQLFYNEIARLHCERALLEIRPILVDRQLFR